MKKILIIAGTSLFIFGCGAVLKEYDHLKEPQIRTMPRQKMLVVEVHGNPNVVGKDALATLYKTFFKLRIKGLKRPPAPCVRWPKPLDTPKDQWIGIYGLPIPESVKSLTPQKKGPKAKIEYWEYGEVAEILHIGPYSEEGPTIERLHQFIEDNGYKITASHEEEYLKGPGMFFKGNPAKYQTIIRHQIEKRG
ncbi:GyrI-like domain-containing protein [bacterium]|nr:GyrI-like domain-containing protein [bacterium]